MMETKSCSLFAAPVIVRNFIGLYGTEKASMSVDTFDQDTGAQTTVGIMFFYDPPNGEIIEQFRRIERPARCSKEPPNAGHPDSVS